MGCISREPKRLVEMTREELEEEQHMDNSIKPLWTAAEQGSEGLRIEGGLLRHNSLDEWGGTYSGSVCCPFKVQDRADHAGKWLPPWCTPGFEENSSQDPEELLLARTPQGCQRILSCMQGMPEMDQREVDKSTTPTITSH